MSSRVVQKNHARNRCGRISHNRRAQSSTRHQVQIREGRPRRAVPGLDEEPVGLAVGQARHGVGLLGAVERVGLVARALPDGDRVAGRARHVAPGSSTDLS